MEDNKGARRQRKDIEISCTKKWIKIKAKWFADIRNRHYDPVQVESQCKQGSPQKNAHTVSRRHM